MESGNKKYYWLKLKRDFFKRHDIRIIEEMPNGKDYILFYLKLLCESVDHEGELRFNESIPYSDVMLSTITNTNIDIVRSAIKAFTNLEMMEVLDDGTIFMSEVEKMIGSAVQDEHTRESTRLRVQAYRERKKLENSDKCYSNSTRNGEIEKEIDIELDKEKEIDKELEDNIVVRPEDAKQKQKRFVKPKLEDVKSYCSEIKSPVDPDMFFDYYEANGWKVGNRSMKDWKAAIRYWGSKEKKTTATNLNQRKGSYFVPNEPSMDYAEYEAQAGPADDLDEDEKALMDMLHGKSDSNV